MFIIFCKGMALICNMIAYQKELFIKIVHLLDDGGYMLAKGLG